MDIWFSLAGGALGGAALTSIFGLVKNRQDRAYEHAQWLRNQKIDVYTNLLRQAHISAHNVSASQLGRKHKKAPKDIIDQTNARLLVVGSREVRSLASLHIFHLEQALASSTGDGPDVDWQTIGNTGMWLEDAIRKDLDVVERQPLRLTVRSWLLSHLVDPWRDKLYIRYFQKHGHAWAHRHEHRQ